MAYCVIHKTNYSDDGDCFFCRPPKAHGIVGKQTPKEWDHQNTPEEPKPPLGLVPRKFHTEQRVFQITEAIDRYTDVRKPIPIEWIEEYNELTKD